MNLAHSNSLNAGVEGRFSISYLILELRSIVGGTSSP